MLTRFTKRVIGVTGASGGMGRGLVERLTHEGGKIVAIDRDKDELQKLQNTYGAENVDILNTDILSKHGQQEVIDALIHFDADSLVNVAGIFKEAECGAFSEEDYEQIMGINLKAPLFICQGIAKHWIAKNDDMKHNIVNISSCASLSPLRGHMIYGLSKAGMDYFTKHMALEFGTKNIQINSINPTIVNSEMGTGPRGYWGNAFRRQWALDRIPMNRFGEVDEIVSLMCYLLSGECGFLNGTNIPVEGGLLNGSSNMSSFLLSKIDPKFIKKEELQQVKDQINELEKQFKLYQDED